MKVPTESPGGKVAGLLLRRRALSLRFFGKGLIRIKLFFVYSIIQPIRLYQRIVSLRLAPSCRFYPSCSHYFIQAISHFGLFKGSCRGFFRILRCNPLSLGGYDPVTGDKNNE